MSNVLLLNASWEPHRVTTVKNAVRLVLLGRADVVEADESAPIRSEREAMPRPTVIRLRKFVKVPRRFRKRVSNTFLFARDGYRCQYCGRSDRELSHREGLNRDHVIPLSRGGQDVWTNVVTSCSTCNSRKDAFLLDEVGMKLLAVPTEPSMVHLRWAVRRLTPTQARYIETFYGAEYVAGLKGMGR